MLRYGSPGLEAGGLHSVQLNPSEKTSAANRPTKKKFISGHRRRHHAGLHRQTDVAMDGKNAIAGSGHLRFPTVQGAIADDPRAFLRRYASRQTKRARLPPSGSPQIMLCRQVQTASPGRGRPARRTHSGGHHRRRHRAGAWRSRVLSNMAFMAESPARSHGSLPAALVTGPATAIRGGRQGRGGQYRRAAGFHHGTPIPAPHLWTSPASTPKSEAAQRKCDFEDIECGMTHEEACAEGEADAVRTPLAHLQRREDGKMVTLVTTKLFACRKEPVFFMQRKLKYRRSAISRISSGACRICMVAVEGQETLVAAARGCGNEALPRQSATSSERRDVYGETSSAGWLANDYNLLGAPYQKKLRPTPSRHPAPILRMVKCMRCASACATVWLAPAPGRPSVRQRTFPAAPYCGNVARKSDVPLAVAQMEAYFGLWVWSIQFL